MGLGGCRRDTGQRQHGRVAALKKTFLVEENVRAKRGKREGIENF